MIPVCPLDAVPGDEVDSYDWTRKEPAVGSYYEDVKAWHRAFDVPVAAHPTPLAPERLALRLDLMREEFREFLDEVTAENPDPAKEAKEAADVLVTVLGTMAERGIPFDAVWAAVHASNMAKLGPGGVLVRRADGKILKPPGWVPPDIAAVLRDAA